ncbi:cation/H(+) antiporter 18-like isoform X1 [Coffea arabica]|uniref:Cation/H(+) antiporter 18-like isoform X1 n=1 Tax=Coffea arabica TaxID=13443 RepID=A0A6P6TU16_COFAR|nr:cation/H(+) antiporter 18-like isoform X1 [Coffea arabica]
MAPNVTCPGPMKATSNGAFQHDNPLDFALPLAILQICLVLVVTRCLAFVLKPLRQPRVIAEIVGGILLGPSALGRNKSYLKAVFPPRSLTVLDTLANIGLLFFLFLAGLELNFKTLQRTGKTALSIAIAGISVPFALGIGSAFALRATIAEDANAAAFFVFMGVALSITAFPVLARILAELKLLTTDIGKMAMSAAAVNDVAAWILLALAVALSGHNVSHIVPLWVFLCGCGFVICASLFVSPIFKWMSRRCQEGEPVSETYICATLAAVLAAAFVTDTIGIHAMFGAFVLGVLVPKEGPFAGALVEKVEDLVSGLFLPLYFVSSGLKTNVATIRGVQSWGLLVLVICTACLGKIVGTFTVAKLWKMPTAEAVALGFLMNSKGLVELIVLNIGKDRKVLNDQTFAIMVLMALFTTFITTPVVLAVYKPAKRTKKIDYKHRTIERKNANSQLRLLACFHSARNIPSMINLFEASRGTDKHESLCVYAMHLMELSERSSAIQMVQKARRNGLPFWNKGHSSGGNHIVVAFEAFQQLSKVSVRSMTSISSLSDMHEDICGTAERKRAAIIILPFHKHQRLDGSLETTRAEFRGVNSTVLEHASCSVGILVDRGLGGNAHVSASNVSYQIVVLFLGGHDDHEALAYGTRMAEHPGIKLTVVRFLVEPKTVGERVQIEGESNPGGNAVSADEEVLADIKDRVSEDDSVNYEERAVGSSNEVIAAIRAYSRCNLFLVGRMPDGEIALALNERIEYPELGPVGSLLTSPDLSTTASVLVVQQYNEKAPADE